MAQYNWLSTQFVETSDFSLTVPIKPLSDVQSLGTSVEEAYFSDGIGRIQPGQEYYAAVAIRYPDGSLGPMSVYDGSAMSIDNVPEPLNHFTQSRSGFQEAASKSSGNLVRT